MPMLKDEIENKKSIRKGKKTRTNLSNRQNLRSRSRDHDNPIESKKINKYEVELSINTMLMDEVKKKKSIEKQTKSLAESTSVNLPNSGHKTKITP